MSESQKCGHSDSKKNRHKQLQTRDVQECAKTDREWDDSCHVVWSTATGSVNLSLPSVHPLLLFTARTISVKPNQNVSVGALKIPETCRIKCPPRIKDLQKVLQQTERCTTFTYQQQSLIQHLYEIYFGSTLFLNPIPRNCSCQIMYMVLLFKVPLFTRVSDSRHRRVFFPKWMALLNRMSSWLCGQHEKVINKDTVHCIQDCNRLN